MPTPADLWEARRKLGLTQAQLAAILGVTDRQVRNWESGRSPIPKMLWLALRSITTT